MRITAPPPGSAGRPRPTRGCDTHWTSLCSVPPCSLPPALPGEQARDMGWVAWHSVVIDRCDRCAPAGALSKLGLLVFIRDWTKASVQVDCNTWEGKITMKATGRSAFDDDA